MSYPAGQISRLTHSWETDPGALNRVLRYQLRILRARARQLSRADGYASKFIGSCEDNIAGPAPFRLQAKIKRPRGTLDSRANKVLETAWREWSESTECDAAGRLTLAAIHRLLIRTLACDGEYLVVLRRGQGSFGLRLQLLEIDRLDEERNEDLRERGAIKMGVEVDGYGRPRAYHVLRQHPGEVVEWGANLNREYVRLGEEDVIHGFVPQSAEQVRGAPWLAPVMFRLWNVSGFEESAVINARVGSNKVGFYTSPDGVIPAGITKGKTSTGQFVQDADPGSFEVLPAGYKLESWDPQFPDASVEPFIRQTLRGVAAGLRVAYHSLANDPSNVNYSTARVALLEERDMWMAMQAWYAEHTCRRIFEAWRDMAVLRGRLPEEAAGPRYASVQWQAKTWDWVDPLKDAQAKIAELGAKLTSRTRIAAEKGIDIEDLLDELAEEAALAAEKGIDLNATPQKPAAPPTDGVTDDGDTTPRHLRAIG